MTIPISLTYELYVFSIYEKILLYIQNELNEVSTLEEDLELLKGKLDSEPLTWPYRMAILYRSEKKKILRSQLNLIEKVKFVLQNIEKVLG